MITRKKRNNKPLFTLHASDFGTDKLDAHTSWPSVKRLLGRQLWSALKSTQFARVYYQPLLAAAAELHCRGGWIRCLQLLDGFEYLLNRERWKHRTMRARLSVLTAETVGHWAFRWWRHYGKCRFLLLFTVK